RFEERFLQLQEYNKEEYVSRDADLIEIEYRITDEPVEDVPVVKKIKIEPADSDNNDGHIDGQMDDASSSEEYAEGDRYS
ncbi:hypothetical protein PMAYCL1PPCAC_09495, partial [Pristionchus mayeri]